jgi:pyruvate,water dikinase
MIGHLSGLGVSVPGGFATTASAFQEFITENALAERIQTKLAALDVEDVDSLAIAGKEIRSWVIDAPLPQALDAAIREGYARMCAEAGAAEVAVAVRSSATAEDLPDASFAGQQETFLNVLGLDAGSRRFLPASITIAPSPTASTMASSTRTYSCPPACS